MGLLIRALAAAAFAATGCYSPSIDSCALPCSDRTDCPDSFSCKDNVCVSGDVTCPARPDAAPKPDAAGAAARIRVEVAGRGRVLVGNEVCGWPTTTECTYDFGVGDMVTLEARQIRNNKPFVGWSEACAGTSGLTCVVTLADPVTVVRATFKE